MTASPARHSALIVTVPHADSAVAEHRRRFDRAALWGVPAHVTVLFPFVVPSAINDDTIDRLADCIGTVPAFEAQFEATDWFGIDVLFLRPEDPGPFLALTKAVESSFPEYPPYGGAHDEVIPHLTVGHHAPVAALRTAEQAVIKSLPITTQVRHVDWWTGRDEPGSWDRFARLELGPPRVRGNDTLVGGGGHG